MGGDLSAVVASASRRPRASTCLVKVGSRPALERLQHFNSAPVCHDSTFVHQVSYQRFWENRWIPDSLPTSPRPRRKPTLVDSNPHHRKRHSSSCQSKFVKKTTIYNSLSLELKEKRSGDFRLFPPANFANSAILPTDKISAFFMQNFLPQKPKDSSL